MAAIDLIAEEPIRFVSKRIVSCDGGMYWHPIYMPIPMLTLY